MSYHPHTTNGPLVRTDVIDVYVFRTSSRPASTSHAHPPLEFLQLLRTSDPLKDTWHPVMGHVELGESAVDCARRELREELALDTSSPLVRGFWALEQVHPFFIAAINTIVMSPRFALEVAPDFVPTLNDEHSSFRWIHQDNVQAHFIWPGQLACIQEILTHILPPTSTARQLLRLPLNEPRA